MRWLWCCSHESASLSGLGSALDGLAVEWPAGDCLVAKLGSYFLIRGTGFCIATCCTVVRMMHGVTHVAPNAPHLNDRCSPLACPLGSELGWCAILLAVARIVYSVSGVSGGAKVIINTQKLNLANVLSLV